MIAHDVSTKSKKSLKKSSVPVVKESEESDSKDFEDSDAEKAGVDSPNEEIENRKNVNTDDETSSGVEGDESDANEEFEQSNSANDTEHGNPHWADAMKKILNTKKPKRKKSIVLSKAKKLVDVVLKPKEVVIPFELQSKEGEVKIEVIKVEKESTEQNQNKNKEKEQRRKNIGKIIRKKPSVLDRDYEKRLQKIATNGVVQLFNAVRQQQKEIEDKLIEAGPLERKKEKALKSINKKTFLDVLMGGTHKLADDSKESNEKDEIKNDNEQENEVWSVLRDDFVMGAKLKDWNKHQTSEEDSSAPEEMDDSD